MIESLRCAACKEVPGRTRECERLCEPCYDAHLLHCDPCLEDAGWCQVCAQEPHDDMHCMGGCDRVTCCDCGQLGGPDGGEEWFCNVCLRRGAEEFIGADAAKDWYPAPRFDGKTRVGDETRRRE